MAIFQRSPPFPNHNFGYPAASFRGCTWKDLKSKTIQIWPYAWRNSHIRYHKSQDLPFPHPHRTPFLVQRFTSRLACSRVPRGSMTPKATNIFAEIKALRMEFEFCYMGVEHVEHHNSFWKSFTPFWLWDGDTHDSAVSSLCIYIYTCVFIPGHSMYESILLFTYIWVV